MSQQLEWAHDESETTCMRRGFEAVPQIEMTLAENSDVNGHKDFSKNYYSFDGIFFKPFKTNCKAMVFWMGLQAKRTNSLGNLFFKSEV